MSELDDHDRYIEYLQTELLTPDWDTLFDSVSWAEWLAKNSSQLRRSALGTFDSDSDPVQHLERLAAEFEPSTRFELHLTRDIFGPLLAKLTTSAGAIGLNPVREVRLATSTDVSATPAARPSSGTHVLFIGLGTYSFCNYWAKAFTALVRTVARARPRERVDSVEELKVIFTNDPDSFLLAARLAVRYAIAGTLLGFGEVRQPADYNSYRLQLLEAMETFVVAHEYSHFVAEERLPQLQGWELEFFCDELALQISRQCASQDDWLAFTGIGPLIFFRSMQLCQIVRDRMPMLEMPLPVPAKDSEMGSTHPLLEDRISAIKLTLISNTAADQRTSVELFIEEYDLIASGLIKLVTDAITPQCTTG